MKKLRHCHRMYFVFDAEVNSQCAYTVQIMEQLLDFVCPKNNGSGILYALGVLPC